MMRGAVRRRAATGSVGVLLAAALLAGCSGDEEPEADASAGASGSASASATVEPGRTSPADLPSPPQVKRATGAVKDATVGECATGKGRQTVTGEVTSSAQRRVDYVVTISWITNKYDVMGLGFAELKGMRPGETRKFEVTAKVAGGATQCTTNVQYGALG